MSADEPLLCGIDAGTSQVRALVFTTEGTVVASAAEPTPIRILGPDSAELDAEGLWQVVLAVLRRVTAQVPDPKAIRSVAVASVGEAGVLLGEDGLPLTPIIAWYDTRTTGELDRLLSTIGFERLHRITGLCADPTFSLLKLMWLKREAPEAFSAARHWLNVGDFIAWRLSGERATDYSLASRTLMLDLEQRSWATAVLEATGIPSALLPPLLASGTALGHVRPEMADATGLPADCMVGVGGHDHVCGLIAAGADRPGVLLDSLGTAEALSLISEAPLVDPALGWDGFNQGVIEVDRPLYYVFGGLPTAAASVEWFRALFAGVDHATLIAEADAAPAGSEGVLFLPHLRLGSPPFPDPIGRGAFVGTVGRDEPRRHVPSPARGHCLGWGQYPQDDAEASGHRCARAGPRDRRQHAQPAPDATQGHRLRHADRRPRPTRHDLPGRRPARRARRRRVHQPRRRPLAPDRAAAPRIA